MLIDEEKYYLYTLLSRHYDRTTYYIQALEEDINNQRAIDQVVNFPDLQDYHNYKKELQFIDRLIKKLEE